MTDGEIVRHATIRRRGIQQIIAEPHLYKACDQCRSILFKRAKICCICGAHRFNEGPVVLATAKEMQLSPFPMTAGIVPRI